MPPNCATISEPGKNQAKNLQPKTSQKLPQKAHSLYVASSAVWQLLDQVRRVKCLGGDGAGGGGVACLEL